MANTAAVLREAIRFWKDFTSADLQSELSSTATEILSRQEIFDEEIEADRRRKRLDEINKLSSDDRDLLNPLFESLQTELELASERCRITEKTFISLHKMLGGIPNMLPLLEQIEQVLQRSPDTDQRLAVDALQVSQPPLAVQNELLPLDHDREGMERSVAEDRVFPQAEQSVQDFYTTASKCTLEDLKEKLTNYENNMSAIVEREVQRKMKVLEEKFDAKLRQLESLEEAVKDKLRVTETHANNLQSALKSSLSGLAELQGKFESPVDLDYTNTVLNGTLISSSSSSSKNKTTSHDVGQTEDESRTLCGSEMKDVKVVRPDSSHCNTPLDLMMNFEVHKPLTSTLAYAATASTNILSAITNVPKGNLCLPSELISSQNGVQNNHASPRIPGDVLMNINILRQTGDFNRPAPLGCVVSSVDVVDSRCLNGAHGEDLTTPLKQEFTHMSSHSHSYPSGDVTPQLLSSYNQPRTPLPYLTTTAAADPINLPLSITTTATAPPSKTSQRNKSKKKDGRNSSDSGRKNESSAGGWFLPDDSSSLDLTIKSETYPDSESSRDSLDTMEVSQRIRDILMAHNIGQRQFAKHVLGLSQGTVSELLSKPKSWDKLTEKGRESYRKMRQWAGDQTNIIELKLIVSRTGQSVVSSAYRHDDSAATEQRIAAILFQAQAAMHGREQVDRISSKGVMSPVVFAYDLSPPPIFSPHQSTPTPPSPFKTAPRSTHSSQNSRPVSRKRSDQNELPNKSQGGSGSDSSIRHSRSSEAPPQNPDTTSRDLVARIYRDELKKLALLAEESGNVAELASYRQELERLAATTGKNEAVENVQSGRNKKKREHGATTKKERGIKEQKLDQSETQQSSNFDLPQTPFSFGYSVIPPNSLPNFSSELRPDIPEDLSIKRSTSPISNLSLSGTARTFTSQISVQKLKEDDQMMYDSVNGEPTVLGDCADSVDSIEGDDGGGDASGGGDSADLSPLEQMQYIANSLSSPFPPGTSGFPNSATSNIRTNLPIITTEQWDRCADLSTDDVVVSIKDMLSEYSISQRLFGEAVLGLSQGSVSDLLARPKVWSMLTQKGREPFVRMQLFLDDPSSVSNLVASQYRVPADKLLRSNSAGCTDTPATLQNRKRKGSTELESNVVDENSKVGGGSSATGSHVKRPRLFFSEEQKDVLRVAYDSDPYPSQSSIDQLATLLGVGPKTVINWFHNHRMRGKNRSHSGGPMSPSVSSPGTSVTGCNNGRQIKTELSEADQSSRSCDSASAEYGRYRVSQWFPESGFVGNGEWVPGSGSNWLTDASCLKKEGVSFDGMETDAGEKITVSSDHTVSASHNHDLAASLQIDDANDEGAKGTSEVEGGDDENSVGGMRLTSKGINKRKRACPQRLPTLAVDALNIKMIPTDISDGGPEQCLNASALDIGAGLKSEDNIIKI